MFREIILKKRTNLFGLITNKSYFYGKIKRMQATCTQLTEIFKTGHGAVYQCNRNNVLVIDFAGQRCSFKISQLFDFTRKVNNIDLAAMIENTSRHADVAILMPYYTERCFVLTIHEVVALKELLCGAKAMIQLNSMINECLLQYA